MSVISIPSVGNRAKRDDCVTLAEPLARQSQGQSYEYARRVLKHYAVISSDAEATNHFRKFGLASEEYLLEKRAR
ncbi:MAG: hypothetical protein ABSD32_17535 [Mycobacterium sp.]